MGKLIDVWGDLHKYIMRRNLYDSKGFIDNRVEIKQSDINNKNE